MNVIGYTRVSTIEQVDSGAGLEVQRQAICGECSRRSWTLLEIIEDGGYAGRHLRRPGVLRALEILQTKQAEGLVVAKLDRLSRSMLDFTAIMAQAKKEQWALVCLDCVDTTTAAGEAMANLLATFAQFESRIIGQRVKEALAIKKAQGVRMGRPLCVPDDVRARIRQLRADGQSCRAIAALLNAENVPTGQGASCWWGSSVWAAAGAVTA